MPPRGTVALTMLAWLVTASPAEAHRLNAEYQVLPGNRVRIVASCAKDDFAADGIVRVYRSNNELLLPASVLDEKGSFSFWYPKAEDLTVEIRHDGHLKRLYIPAGRLADADNSTATSPGDDWDLAGG